jgi:hypothetical protein
LRPGPEWFHHQPGFRTGVQEFKRYKEFVRWLEQQKNANNKAERMVSRSDSAGLAPLRGAYRRETGKASS